MVMLARVRAKPWQQRMNRRIKLISALGAFTAILIVAAFVLPAEFPAHSQGWAGVAHSHTGDPSFSTGPSAFHSEMAQVNARMHEAMDIVPSGDIERDFLRMMIPHHQGAIDMAVVLLKYGSDERLKRLAQTIIVEQSQEVAYMRMIRDARSNMSSADPTTHQ
jgi:hypothetical protein